MMPTAANIAEVAWCSAVLLGPRPQLQGACDCEERDEAVAARGGVHCAKAGGDALKARELHEVLDDSAHGCHHRGAAMLDLSGAEVAEGLLVALFAEAEGVKVTQGLRDTNLEGR